MPNTKVKCMLNRVLHGNPTLGCCDISMLVDDLEDFEVLEPSCKYCLVFSDSAQTFEECPDYFMFWLV